MRLLGAIPCALALLLALGAAGAQAVELHAHRGGTLAEGRPVVPENSLRAFRRAAEMGADVVELDAKLSADGVPVVMHDATLDRTTDCSGRVRARTAAELRSCHVDILGTSGSFVQLPESREPVPELADVLAWARDGGARLNLEIKNVPTDPDFDPTPGFARAVVAAVDASGMDRDRVLIQSFWPPNLDQAELAGYETSLLTLGPMNEGGIPFATAHGYDWVSPQWPPLDPAAYVDAAHAAGRLVVPFTLNAPDAIAAARDAGVDAVISDDPVLARRVLGAGG